MKLHRLISYNKLDVFNIKTVTFFSNVMSELQNYCVIFIIFKVQLMTT